MIAVFALVLAVAVVMPARAAGTPSITYTCTPAPSSCMGWYREPVTINWDWLPTNATVVAGCDSYDPVDFDTSGEIRYCKVSDGVAVTVEVSLRVDMTPPLVTGATPSRAPDTNGWYRSPVQVAFSGTDDTSGLAGCTSLAYAAPDSAAAQLAGICHDRAGNVSAPSFFALRFDATPPSLNNVRTRPGDRVVRLEWTVPNATAVEVWRRPRPHGVRTRLLSAGPEGRFVDRRVRNGRRYQYLLTAVDPAGNSARRTVAAIPGPRLLAPARAARVTRPPLLEWTSVRHARYYNVQLYRGQRKILSAWPGRSRLQLRSSWRYQGHRRRLVPGRRYTWIVWPGRGPRTRSSYGPRLGKRTFLLVRAP